MKKELMKCMENNRNKISFGRSIYPNLDREILKEKTYIPFFNLLKHQISKIDRTEKFLFELEDKGTIGMFYSFHCRDLSFIE